MREIALTKGYVALVDEDDYDELMNYKWSASRYSKGLVYAVRWSKRTITLMHRQILGITDPLVHTDHRNHNGIDNRKSNLRTCTRSQNQHNTRKQAHTSSQYKGVYLCKPYKKWRAAIYLAGKQTHLGYHTIEEDAAKAYDKAALELFGDFANINFMR